jgi:hypothetical protein
MRFLRNEFEQEWEWEDELEFESEFEFDFSTEIEYLIGDAADPPNQGRNPNPHHNKVLKELAQALRNKGWTDIRREQAQVAGTLRPVQATERPYGSKHPGMNFPDLSGVDTKNKRVHIEVDTNETRSLTHQDRIFTADANETLSNVASKKARKARGIFFVINPATGNVTSVRHVSHRKNGGNGLNVTVRRYGTGVPIANLLENDVLNWPVNKNAPGLWPMSSSSMSSRSSRSSMSSSSRSSTSSSSSSFMSPR